MRSDVVGREVKFSAFDVRFPFSRGDVELIQSTVKSYHRG